MPGEKPDNDDANNARNSKGEIGDKEKKKLKELMKEIEDSKDAYLLNESLEVVKRTSSKGLGSTLSRIRDSPAALVIDGTVTSGIVYAAEKAGVQAIAAKNSK